jgi:PleD family two-component response regulator
LAQISASCADLCWKPKIAATKTSFPNCKDSHRVQAVQELCEAFASSMELRMASGESAFDEAPAVDQSACGALVVTAGGKRPRHRRRLLVVDDNEVNRDMLLRRFATTGAQRGVAANGQQALAMLRSESFDVVLLDILMPGMNGYQVLEHMKTDAELRHLRSL